MQIKVYMAHAKNGANNLETVKFLTVPKPINANKRVCPQKSQTSLSLKSNVLQASKTLRVQIITSKRLRRFLQRASLPFETLSRGLFRGMNDFEGFIALRLNFNNYGDILNLT